MPYARIAAHLLAPCAFVLSSLCSLARADVVADWNAIAVTTVKSAEPHAANAARAMASVHIAMFEVMNFIEGGYVPRFLVTPSYPLGISSEAAAAAAAHYVLVQLYPGHIAALDAALGHALARIPDGQEKSSGQFTGAILGANIYPAQASDGISTGSQAGRLGPASESLTWNSIAAKLIEAQRLKPIEAARMHALVSMAISDVYSAAGESGYARSSCVSCAAGMAALVIFESDSGLAAGRTKAMPGSVASGAPDGWIRVRDRAYESSLRTPEGVNRRISIRTSEEIGRRIGLQALTYYMSRNREIEIKAE